MPRLLSPLLAFPRIRWTWVPPAAAPRWPLPWMSLRTWRPANPRRWLWGVVGALLALEALALVVICLWQLRLAEVRENEQRLRAARYVQCLEQTPGASIARCRRLAASAAR